jgi:hypothetical protein
MITFHCRRCPYHEANLTVFLDHVWHSHGRRPRP